MILKENKEQLEAAVVKEEVPVFEFIGDTLKYNVAAVQQVSSDDMLADVMERLPGISVSNNLVEAIRFQPIGNDVDLFRRPFVASWSFVPHSRSRFVQCCRYERIFGILWRDLAIWEQILLEEITESV